MKNRCVQNMIYGSRQKGDAVLLILYLLLVVYNFLIRI